MKKTVRFFFKKGDLILYFIIIIITIIPFINQIYNQYINQNELFNYKNIPLYVEINYNGQFFKYPVNEDRIISFKNDSILIEIKDKKVRVKESDCPDKLCVKKGWIDKIDQFIICMPNKLEVKLIGKEELDGITY